MPSRSKKQYDLMKIASYNKDFADKRHIDQDAAREWHQADKDMEKKHKDFYKNLPDHAVPTVEAKKSKKKRTSQRRKREKAQDASMESIVASIVDLFRSNRTIDDVPDHVSDAMILKLSSDPKALDGMQLRTGPIDVRGINSQLLLNHWSNNWLSEVEKNATAIDNFYTKFIPARVAYGLALEKIYKQCEKLTPEQALEYAKPRVNMEKIKLGRINLPELRNLSITQVPDGHGMKLSIGTADSGPGTMEALTEGAIRKVVAITSLLVRSYDYEDIEGDSWYLDDTDEYKWWAHHFPGQDAVWGKLLNLFPSAGEWYEFAYDDVLDKAIEHMYLGLKSLVMKSIK